MRRRRLLVVVWACAWIVMGLGASASAQSVSAVGGASLARVVFDDTFASSTAFVPGLTGGVGVSIGLVRRVGVSAEGLFTVERARLEGGPEDRFQYLDVPVFVRYRLSGADRDHAVTVLGGAMYRRVVKATEISFGESSDISDGVHADDVAAVVGVEAAIGPRWVLGARYVHGQNEIYRRFNGAYSGRWRTMQVLLRYAIWR